jgi:hypothetical protein
VELRCSRLSHPLLASVSKDSGTEEKNGACLEILILWGVVCADVQLFFLKVDADFDNLRSDPRFTELLRRMNLAP